MALGTTACDENDLNAVMTSNLGWIVNGARFTDLVEPCEFGIGTGLFYDLSTNAPSVGWRIQFDGKKEEEKERSSLLNPAPNFRSQCNFKLLKN